MSSQQATGTAPLSAEATLNRYLEVRAATEKLCTTLETEDYVIQSMADVSPTKWHLAHTTWFFETFLLKPSLRDYVTPDEHYEVLFNSYYNAVGEQWYRPHRGLLSRPTVKDVYEYRAHVDTFMRDLLSGADEERMRKLGPLVEIGVNHEQQHQELMLTDIKHVLAFNPLRPQFGAKPTPAGEAAGPLEWITFAEGVHEIGHEGSGFAYDNERPRHRTFVQPFRLATRLVTNGEFRAFMEDGGYKRPELWLSEGWAAVQGEGWGAPLYWERRGRTCHAFTLSGFREVNDNEPVCHVSYFEADAYARWAGKRLPTEFEWEVAAAAEPVEGNFVDDRYLNPAPASALARRGRFQQLFGDAWQWTMSHYSPYPGYRTPEGAIGEYNGKFMVNQFVLRGGSCATPVSHIRKTYRNFFPSGARWQFTGIRLADEA